MGPGAALEDPADDPRAPYHAIWALRRRRLNKGGSTDGEEEGEEEGDEESAQVQKGSTQEEGACEDGTYEGDAQEGSAAGS